MFAIGVNCPTLRLTLIQMLVLVGARGRHEHRWHGLPDLNYLEVLFPSAGDMVTKFNKI